MCRTAGLFDALVEPGEEYILFFFSFSLDIINFAAAFSSLVASLQSSRFTFTFFFTLYMR